MKSGMFYKGNGYALTLVSFPSKSLEKERGVEGFRCEFGGVYGIPTIASRRGNSSSLIFLINSAR